MRTLVCALALVLAAVGPVRAEPQAAPPDWAVAGFRHALLDDSAFGAAVTIGGRHGLFAPHVGDAELNQAIVRRLEDTDPETRQAAIAALNALEAAGHADAIAARARDEDASVREAAVATLGDFGAVDHASAVAERLGDDDPATRARAVTALASLRGRDAAPAVAERLGDGGPSVRIAALRALAEVDAAAWADAVAARLRDDHNMVRDAAVDALVRLNARDQIPAVVAMLEADDGNVRRAALRALVALGAAERTDVMAPLVRDADRDVREAAVRALGALDARDRTEAIAGRLDDDTADVRVAALDALARLGAAEYADAVVERLGDVDGDVATAAAHALGVLGAIDRTSAVAAYLDAPRGEVRAAAITALSRLGADDRARDVVASLTDADWRVRRAAVAALGALGAVDQAPAVAALLDHRAPRIRETALKALAELGAVDHTAAVAARLDDDDPGVREAALGALLSLDAVEQAPAIARRLPREHCQVRVAAIEALGALDARDHVDAILPQLGESDCAANPLVRAMALEVLRNVGAAAHAPVIVDELRRPSLRGTAMPWFVANMAEPRRAAELALLSLPRVAVPQASLAALAHTHRDPTDAAFYRAWAYVLGGGEPVAVTGVRFLGLAPRDRLTAAPADALGALRQLRILWPATAPWPRLRDDAADAAANLVGRACARDRDLETTAKPTALWTATVQHLRRRLPIAGTSCWPAGARPLLAALRAELAAAGYATRVDTLDGAITAIDRADGARRVLTVAAAHLGLWALLFAAYPWSRSVQALVFWNPWVRRGLGLGYVGLALTYVPPLRRLLLRPFRRSLLADAQLADLARHAVFTDARLRLAGTERRALDVLSPLRGQFVIEGESGIGKSFLLRHLAGRSRRLTVFLPAYRCEGGVLAAIQAKLQGAATDTAFLKSIVHLGALDILVDGVNEVAPETRAKIADFVQEHFAGNVLLATQPFSTTQWQPPTTAERCRLLPLDRGEIATFLISRVDGLPEDAVVTGEAYRLRARAFVDALDDDGLRAVLANPMDAQLAAEILARGETPDLLGLQEQAFALMRADYARLYPDRRFPTERLAEAVYRMRLEDRFDLSGDDFAAEIAAMEPHKMLLRRVTRSAAGTRTMWRFRHDRLVDFFLYQAFFDDTNGPERQRAHLDDPRFRGVYLMIAQRAPLDVARALRERLVVHAAATGDHSLSDNVVRLLLDRTPVEAAAS
mgnify:CR=1 FL=1